MTYTDNSNTRLNDQKHVQRAMKAPLLEKEHELDLARRWHSHKDTKALHELTSAYLRLVVKMANKFKYYGLDVNDLIQEGSIGLMQAADRFDPELGNRFSTYAIWWIRASIQDYVLRNWSIVRTGSTASQKSLFFNLRRLRAKIEGQSAKEYLDAEGIKAIATELNVKESDVEKMEARLFAGDASLNVTIGDEGSLTQWQDLLPDEVNPDPEQVVIGMKDNETRSEWLSQALSTLNPREKNIIRQRKLSDEIVTLDMLGQELGISKERVRQIEKKAMDKIQSSITVNIMKTDTETRGLYL